MRPIESTRPQAAVSDRKHAITRRKEAQVKRSRFGLDAAWQRIRLYRDRRRSRRALIALDDHALKDIGITRLEAEEEANRPFWLPWY